MSEITEDKAKKKKRAKSLTHETIKYLSARNIPAQVVEKYIITPGGGFRKDTFGADVQALTKSCIIGIQVGAASNLAEKVQKAINHPHVKLWLESPSRVFQIWTWKQRPAFNKDGKRRKKDKWTPTVTEIYKAKDGTLAKRRFNLLGSGT